MGCVHLGGKAGSLVSTCCGGKERLVDLYECLSDVKSEQYTVPNAASKSMAAIDVGGDRSVASVAGCVGCQLFESAVENPVYEEVKPTSNARRMWEALRQKRNNGVKPAIEQLNECFTGYVHQETTITTRHLLYHIWPRTGSNWREHVAGIERRLPLFNGKKIVSVATGDDTDDIDLPWADKIIRKPNNPRLGEVVTFVDKLFEVADIGSDEAFFYCHAKGVRHNVTNETTVSLWSDIMLEVLLDHWLYVGGLLNNYPIVGAFKKNGRSLAPSAAIWHYTGTFYWCRNDIFARDWKKIEHKYWGTEAWPGVHFTQEEGGCAFISGAPAIMNLYDMHLMLDKVQPRLELLRSTMSEYRTDYASK